MNYWIYYGLIIEMLLINIINASWLTVVRSVPVKMRTGLNGRLTNSTQRTLSKLDCRKDKHCAPGSFCHKHFGLCHKCRQETKLCRRNKMCCNGLECISGVCRKKLYSGLEKSSCRMDRDCNPGLCCAKSDGVLVCKKMLGNGDLCSVPDGGIIYSMNHTCPCADGLKCRKVHKRSRRSQASLADSFLLSWIQQQERRCRT